MSSYFNMGLLTGIMIVALIVLIMAVIVDTHNDIHYRKILVENGCGQYNQTTSEFELIDMKKEQFKQ